MSAMRYSSLAWTGTVLGFRAEAKTNTRTGDAHGHVRYWHLADIDPGSSMAVIGVSRRPERLPPPPRLTQSGRRRTSEDAPTDRA